MALKLGHVDWERGRITITSPKTEHHEGKECADHPAIPGTAAVAGASL